MPGAPASSRHAGKMPAVRCTPTSPSHACGAGSSLSRMRERGLSQQRAGLIGVEGGEVFRAEIIDVARGGEADRGGVGGESDRQIEIAFKEAVNEPGNKRVAGADAVDDFDRIARRMADGAVRQQDVPRLQAG